MINDNEEVAITLANKLEELKKAVNRTANWQERLTAVHELGKLESMDAIKVLQYVMNGDSVAQVREAAYRTLKQMGADVQMPAKDKGEQFKNLNKILLRIKKSLPADHSYEDFKVKLQKMRVDIYNTYEGNKGEAFDAWLSEKWEAVSTRK